MKDYRVFEVTTDEYQKLKGKISLRLDDEDKTIFQKLRGIGLKINRRWNKIEWWDDDYVEIINKKTDKTVGILEMCYR